jgi:hypothetical protein
MIHYVVVHGTPRAVQQATPRLAPALATTRIMKGKRLQHEAEDGTWAAAAITKEDPIAARRLIARGDDVVLVNGPARRTGVCARSATSPASSPSTGATTAS